MFHKNWWGDRAETTHYGEKELLALLAPRAARADEQKKAAKCAWASHGFWVGPLVLVAYRNLFKGVG